MRTAKPAKIVRVHIGESDQYRGRPLYEAIVERCRELKIEGATVFRGLEGYGETAEIHRRHVARRDQPIVVTIVDSDENVRRLIGELAQMIDTGLIATSEVQSIRVENPRREE